MLDGLYYSYESEPIKFKFWISFAWNGVFKLKACWLNYIGVPALQMTAEPDNS